MTGNTETKEFPKVVRSTPEEDAALAPKLIAALKAKGYRSQGITHRREVFQVLTDFETAQAAGYREEGYRPTQAEINDKMFSKGNWGVVPTGRTLEYTEVGAETPDVTKYQNQELEVFTCDPEIADAQTDRRTFDEITAEVRIEAALAEIALKPRG